MMTTRISRVTCFFALLAMASAAPIASAGFIQHDSAASDGGTFNASFLIGNLTNGGHTSPVDTENTVGTLNVGYATANPPIGGYPASITMNFNTAQGLTDLYLWNHSFGGNGPGNGVGDFSLTFYDGAAGAGSQIGTVINASAAQAPAGSGNLYAAEVFNFGSTRNGVRSVVMVAHSHTDGAFIGIREVAFNAVPEPSSLTLCGLGLAAIAFYRRHRR